VKSTELETHRERRSGENRGQKKRRPLKKGITGEGSTTTSEVVGEWGEEKGGVLLERVHRCTPLIRDHTAATGMAMQRQSKTINVRRGVSKKPRAKLQSG